MVVDTRRYSSGQLISISQTLAVAELGIKGPLEYLQVQATTLVSLLHIHMIPIACKITIFPYTCMYNNYKSCMNAVHALILHNTCIIGIRRATINLIFVPVLGSYATVTMDKNLHN